MPYDATCGLWLQGSGSGRWSLPETTCLMGAVGIKIKFVNLSGG